jgi:CheY-like chemotaxis protein
MQWSQYRVAANIGIGDRQLLREEKAAVELLAQLFWREYRLDQKAAASPGSQPAVSGPVLTGSSSLQAELEPFGEMTSLIQPDLVFLNHLVQDVIKTLLPVLDRSSVQIHKRLGKDQRLFIRAPVLRQALLLLFNQAVARAPHGAVTVQSGFTVGRVSLTLRTSLPASGSMPSTQEWAGSGDVQRLIALCGGEVQFFDGENVPSPEENAENTVLFARVLFSATPQIRVLFIDDHADTLQLYQRLLEGTRYHFLSATNARHGLTIAKNDQPQLIVVDVMMPQNDGWDMLAQLRVHPKTQHIPVLVCSIVPQQELAQALGAMEFLQKPISRENLLASLDRHLTS